MAHWFAVTVVVAAVMAFVIAVGEHDALGASTDAPTRAAAIQTVRDFLAESSLDGNGYLACAYVTPGAAGPDDDCSTAVIVSPPALPHVHSDTELKRLPMAATIRGGVAYVHVRGAFTVVLTRTTPAERSAFDAPASDWRIAGFR